jgi:hypothetical protein
MENTKPRILATVDLYEYKDIAVAKYDLNTQSHYADTTRVRKSFKIYGTQEQIDKHLKPLPVDEVYVDRIETKGSYYEGICFSDNPKSKLPTLVEYNTKLQARLNRIDKIYQSRGSKVLVQ